MKNLLNVYKREIYYYGKRRGMLLFMLVAHLWFTLHVVKELLRQKTWLFGGYPIEGILIKYIDK